MVGTGSPIRQRTSQRKRAMIFLALIIAATFLGIVVLGTLIVEVFHEGSKWLDWEFITSFPSRFPARAGIRSALFGTLWLMGLTALFVFPIGVGASVYLEEYAPKNWLISAVRLNISNLAGVPSIVYGILGLTLFVRAMALEKSVMAGALTIALLILPIIIIASQEAIRAVPVALRQGAYALGATRWQTTWNIVLPQAMPGILTGTILALSRGIGETAPLIMIGALTFIAFSPTHPLDPFTVLPIQIFNWTSRPQEDFRGIAAAGIIVLLAMLFVMNAGAIILRNRYQRRGEG